MNTKTIGLQPTLNLSNQQAVMDQVRGLIENHIRNQPRSLQKQIGPSEIGDPCDHCLAAKLAGWHKKETSTAWLPFIGTAVHAYLEHLFTSINSEENQLGRGNTFLCEQRVTVGQIGGIDITGSTDLYLPTQIDTHPEGGMTVDWKIVGKNTLDRVKRTHDPGQKYVTQAHLYAKGWNQAGHPTSHVCIYFMPRNSMSLDDGHIWIDKYRPYIAQNALDRANKIRLNLDALETINTKTRDAWISSLPRNKNCFDCRKYDDWNINPDGTPNLNKTLNQSRK